MSHPGLDISENLTWHDGLPYPDWELISMWVDSQCSAAQTAVVWIDILRQWLEQLGSALGKGYQTIQSANCLILAPRNLEHGHRLLPFAERCRASLLTALPGIAAFEHSPKQVVLVFDTPDEFYSYISRFFDEGEYGSIGGIQIRTGYPHIALYGKDLGAMENVLAHEMTHAALARLSLPRWLEEGMAQTFEHNMTGRQLLIVNQELADRHKRYWHKHGLEIFWHGEGFTRPGTVQELCYQLAEILVRLLLEESRPRWFGWVKEPQRRFFAFLEDASDGDCGESASQSHRQASLGDLAARFLGPGDWAPSL